MPMPVLEPRARPEVETRFARLTAGLLLYGSPFATLFEIHLGALCSLYPCCARSYARFGRFEAHPVGEKAMSQMRNWMGASIYGTSGRWSTLLAPTPAGTTLAGARLAPVGTTHLFTAHPAQHSGKDVCTSRILGFLSSLAWRRHSFDRCFHLKPLDRSSPLKPLGPLTRRTGVATVEGTGRGRTNVSCAPNWLSPLFRP